MPEIPPLVLDLTQEAIDAAIATDAKGTELGEQLVHSWLDKHGVPREGRKVQFTLETITIDLPPGWWFAE